MPTATKTPSQRRRERKARATGTPIPPGQMRKLSVDERRKLRAGLLKRVEAKDTITTLAERLTQPERLVRAVLARELKAIGQLLTEGMSQRQIAEIRPEYSIEFVDLARRWYFGNERRRKFQGQDADPGLPAPWKQFNRGQSVEHRQRQRGRERVRQGIKTLQVADHEAIVADIARDLCL